MTTQLDMRLKPATLEGQLRMSLRAVKHTQQARVLDLLKHAEQNTRQGWVPLPEILDLRIANYRARISELRRQGHNIECRTHWHLGVRQSWYRLAGTAAIYEAQK